MAESTFGTTSVVNVDAVDIDVSSVADGQVVVYDGTKFVSGYHVPVGTVEMWGGLSTSVPYGWLLCDGQQVSSSSALGAVIGTRYNTGGETAGNVRVPNMSAVIPTGIAAGANAGTTNFSYPSASATHTHASFTADTATTSYDGLGQHTHQYADGGAHSHSLDTAAFAHTHNLGTPSTTHTHNTGGSNVAFVNTGNFTHLASNHGDSNNESASHTHDTGNPSYAAGATDHTHNVSDNTNSATHNHTWENSTTSTVTSGAGSHNHTITVVSVCFIIKA